MTEPNLKISLFCCITDETRYIRSLQMYTTGTMEGDV